MDSFKLILLLVLLSAANNVRAQQELTCAKEIGNKNSQILVNWCLQVTPATHPPCNAQNSCNLIVSEIQRGCQLLSGDKSKPYYCLLTYSVKEQ